ncbi:hypothetical protein LUTEI9C_100165 [Luteimonas sp. 9C]|nr:hypothetical protein LUTEI9C_100165 [Luteimonas sp. 9C]
MDVSGRRFSLVPFLLASTKRNELGRVSGRKRLTLLLRLFAYGDKQDQTLPLALRRVGSFLLLAPRTQCERRSRPRRGEHRRCESKKRNQRKGPAPTEQIRPVIRSGIFRLAILARSKNAAHPCAAPYGSASDVSASRESKSTATAEQLR